jgi:2',3'-cyclic-nucleotide 2'-phosphodiesterase (5'-nucleotidase family)
MDRAKAIMKEADFPYLSCNWVDLRTTLRVLPSVKVFVRGGRRIAFVGVTTPETFTKSTPAYFMDKAQRKYIYDIQGGEDGKKLYDAVQKAIDKAKLLADVVIGLGHLGVDPSSSPWTSEEVIAHTSGFDAFIDGHSHTVMENKQVQDASGKAVTLTQTGSYFANVGEMTIAADGTITTKLIPTHEGMDAGIAAMQTGWVNTVDDMLGEKIAVGDSDFYVSDPATGKRRIRSAETNLGDFVADGIYTYFNEVEKLHCDVAIMNGGGIRADVPAGDWTFKTCKQVSPFGNVACLMSVTGKQIQDALEFAARFAGEDGKENGGFLQVAGATYEIHTDIPNTVQTDEKNVWIGSATGTPRVQNVKIYDKASGSYLPLDPGATYALAGMNYTLRNLGDGFAMFDGAELIKDYVSEDYLVMSTYAMIFDGADAAGLPHLSSANSPLAAYPGYLLNYEQPYGAGRITIL